MALILGASAGTCFLISFFAMGNLLISTLAKAYKDMLPGTTVENGTGY